MANSTMSFDQWWTKMLAANPRLAGKEPVKILPGKLRDIAHASWQQGAKNSPQPDNLSRASSLLDYLLGRKRR